MFIELINLDNAQISMITRLAVAALLGSIVGLERDIHGRNAGLRTHLLVCMGSALFMIISELIATRARISVGGLAPVNADPARIAAQVVTGIGFIGAGAILKSGLSVRGLTTAATLWIVASIGLAVGAGGFVIASVTTSFTVLSLVLLNYFERCYKKDSYRRITVEVNGSVEADVVKEYISHKSVEFKSFQTERNFDKDYTSFTFMLRVFSRGTSDKISDTIIKQLEESQLNLKYVKWGK